MWWKDLVQNGRLPLSSQSSLVRFGLAAAVGAVAGLGAIAFQYGSQALVELALGQIAGYHPRLPGGEGGAGAPSSHPVLWLLLLLPSVGGLIAGFIIFRYAPEAEGHGTDAALETYHNQRGRIRWQVPIVKTIASVLTLGTGGSGGREGPIAQIGAGFGSVLATRLKLSVKDRRILLAAGLGAGVGAIFRAPLAGALFAAEIHYREPEFESEVVIPAAIASITGYCIFTLAFGGEPLFSAHNFGFDSPLELLPYTALALAVSLGAVLFVRVFYGLRDAFAKLKMPDMYKPALGGLGTGIVGVGLYLAFSNNDALSVLAFGYGAIQGALDTQIPIAVLLAVALGKMVTTGLSIGSGGSGGVFGPSMVIGGCIGGVVGSAFHDLMPSMASHPGAFVLVGMAGFFAGAANTPVSTIIMVSEMTGHYELLLPSLWVCAIAYLLLRKVSLYENQLRSRVDSPAHRGDLQFDILEEVHVRDVYTTCQKADLKTFAMTDSLGKVFQEIAHTHQIYFPVTDQDGRLTAIFSLNDIREYMYEQHLWETALTADFAHTKIYTVCPNDSLRTALEQLQRCDVEEMPVVDDVDPRRLLGVVRRKDITGGYNRRLWELRQQSREDAQPGVSTMIPAVQPPPGADLMS